MDNYKIVQPGDYTKEHLECINKFKNSMYFFAPQTDIMFLLKDINFRGIIGSDVSAKTFGLKSGKDFIGKCIADFPCESIVKHAAQITRQEQDLIDTLDIDKKLEVLCVFDYCDGLKARVANKRLFYHQPSASILGVISTATNVKLRDFINIVPTYILRFGVLGSIGSMKPDAKIHDMNLTEYEQEICFLFLLGWDFKQVANFMDVFRPQIKPRTTDAVIKKKNYICQKLNLTNTNLKNLCEYLFSIGFHTKMPESFYSRMIGAKIVS
ncbi:MAG: hypothetical protein K0R94_167 [Burkholderiales bacterium]|nr:hypothetical protein [Burkholderiales bacterium]